MSSLTLCKAARHALSGPQTAEIGKVVCRVCIEGLERDVLDLVRMHDAMLADQAWRVPSDGPIVTGSKERPLPVNPHLALARTEIELALFAWARYVAGENRCYMPERPTLTWAASTLVTFADWLARCDEAVQLVDGLRELATGWVRSAAQPSGSVRASAGQCPLCGADAIGVIRPADDDRESTIVCKANRDHQWAPHEWSLVLGCTEGEGATVDTSAAARLLRIDESSLRALVSRGRIARTDGGRLALSDLCTLYGELWGASA